MKERSYGLLINLLNIVLIFLSFYSMILFWAYSNYQTKQNDFYPFGLFLMILVPFLLYAIRLYCKRPNHVMFLHGAVALAGCFLFPLGSCRIYGTILVFLSVIVSFYQIFREDRVQRPANFFLILFIVAAAILNKSTNIYLYGKDYGKYSPNALNLIFFIIGTAFILIYFYNMYIANFHSFIRHNNHITKGAFKQMKHSNNSILALFLLICFIMISLFSLLPLDDVLQQVYHLVFIAARAVLSCFIKDGVSPSPNMGLSEPSSISTASAPEFSSGSLLGNILTPLLAVVLAGFAIYAIYKIYLNYLANYHTETDEAVFLKQPSFLSENSSIMQHFFKPGFGKDNRSIIRRHYYQTVDNLQEGRKATIPEPMNTLAPKELSKALASDAEEKMQLGKLADYYEKARYSQLECTDEDVNAVKNILSKNIKNL